MGKILNYYCSAAPSLLLQLITLSFFPPESLTTLNASAFRLVCGDGAGGAMLEVSAANAPRCNLGYILADVVGAGA